MFRNILLLLLIDSLFKFQGIYRRNCTCIYGRCAFLVRTFKWHGFDTYAWIYQEEVRSKAERKTRYYMFFQKSDGEILRCDYGCHFYTMANSMFGIRNKAYDFHDSYVNVSVLNIFTCYSKWQKLRFCLQEGS